jgi:taurine dioxygenase
VNDLSIEPITPSVGAEIRGVDLATQLGDPNVVSILEQAFLDHHVLVFRDQELTRSQHKDFGRLFGPLHVHPTQRGADYEGDREIFPIEADETTVLNNGGLWHSDVSCDAVPPLGSMLLLKEAPAQGGDTLFANMHLAYESLSEPIREMIDGLDALHDRRQDLSHYGLEPRLGIDYPASVHPIVVTHPETGRRLLFVNPAFTTKINGLSSRESDAILRMLYDHTANNPSIQCRVRWEPGTLTFWDNRCVQHYAVWDYRPQRRIGERVTIASDVAPSRG